MDNPYQSPEWRDGGFQDQPGNAGLPPSVAPTPGMVGQVRVVGILMAVQGSLTLLVGGFLIFYGILMPTIMNQAIKGNPNMKGNAGQPPENFAMWMMIGMSVFGGIILLISILEIVAGVRAYQFRNRGLVIGMLIAGLVPMFSCYCAPTAIAMAVYGLIVLFNPQVMAAFQLSKQGLTGEQILASFYQGRIV